MKGNLAFYEAAAQVIPVLFLALVVGQSTIVGPMPPDKVMRRAVALLTIGAVVMLAAAEYGALSVLFEQRETPLGRNLTSSGLIIGGQLLITQVLVRLNFRMRSEAGAPDTFIEWCVLISVVVLVIAVNVAIFVT